MKRIAIKLVIFVLLGDLRGAESGNVGTSDLIELLGNWGPCPK